MHTRSRTFRCGSSRARRMMSSLLQMSAQCSNHCVRREVIPDTPSTQVSVTSSDLRHSLMAAYCLGSLRRSATLDDKT